MEDRENGDGGAGLGDDDLGGLDVREQDHLLPIANIGRIMKAGMPASAKISKDAKETVQECVSEFISFITAEANDKCVQEKRKTINGEDLIWAMRNLGFDNYAEPLSVYLSRYKETMSTEVGTEVRGQRRKRDSSENTDDMVDANHTAAAAAAAGCIPPFPQCSQPMPYAAGQFAMPPPSMSLGPLPIPAGSAHALGEGVGGAAPVNGTQ